MLITHLAGSVALHPFTALAAFQAQDSLNSGHPTLFIVCIVIIAAAMLIQALVLIGAALGAIKAQKELTSELHEFRAKAIQLIDKSETLVTQLTPQIQQIAAKVNTITAHVEHIAALVHEKADEFSPTISAANQTVVAATETVREANLKTRAQVSRVDGMVTSALNGAVRLGIAIEQGIAKPGREVAGIFAGLKAGLETLITGARAFGSGVPVGRTVNQRPSTPPRPTYPYPAQKPDLDL